jgi:hypothetical protein
MGQTLGTWMGQTLESELVRMGNNLPDVELPVGFWTVLGLTPVPGWYLEGSE